MAVADEARNPTSANQAVYDASRLRASVHLECDVAVIGSGAGGATAAEILSQKGLKVIIVEEGPYKRSADFKMREALAYPQLYQDSGARKTKDKAISIYQGRCVGGSTTVNWTTSFRTPKATLEHWQRHHGLSELSYEVLDPWFAQIEEKLAMTAWQVAPNENNATLARGAEALAYHHGIIKRNVKGCANLGYCGMGCPVDAKQSMLVTSIPRALEHGAEIWSRLRADALLGYNGVIRQLRCQALAEDGVTRLPYEVTIKAKSYVLAAGAIGTPALLLRSGGLDPYGRVGKRTFLHPVNIVAGVFGHEVKAYAGAPQSVYSDEFLWPEDDSITMGFKIETPPVHPLLAATVLRGFGKSHYRMMRHFNKMAVFIALMRDGFHDESPGGEVVLDASGDPQLTYPIPSYLWESFRRSYEVMSEIQFAAGAKMVHLVHENAAPCRTFAVAKKMIRELPMEPMLAKLASAHVMGGCPMGSDEKTSVVNSAGKHHHSDNLYVFDGSVFPTSLGTNPQLSIYALSARNATTLAQVMEGRGTAAGTFG